MSKDLRNKLLADRALKRKLTLKKFDDAEVEVRSLSTGQRLQLIKDCTVNGTVDMSRLIPQLVQLTTYDPSDGTLVFEPTDIDPINGTNASDLDELLEVTLELNGFDNVTDAAKNSVSGQTSITPSSSQSVSAAQ